MQEMKSAEVTEPRLQLLSKITGAFQPGVLTALVGVSGAGYVHISGILSDLSFQVAMHLKTIRGFRNSICVHESTPSQAIFVVFVFQVLLDLHVMVITRGEHRGSLIMATYCLNFFRKTTLMDVLAGRKTGGYIEGDIRISGYPKNQKTFARISGYCEQNDIHSPQITVRESLIYSAWLRLAEEVDDATKMVK